MVASSSHAYVYFDIQFMLCKKVIFRYFYLNPRENVAQNTLGTSGAELPRVFWSHFPSGVLSDIPHYIMGDLTIERMVNYNGSPTAIRALAWRGVACRLIDAGQNQGTLEGLSDWFVGVLYYSGEIGSFPSAI